ncbi:hypothetical protein B0H14DRAFT_3860532 [Mycena olivaceomarginata]|nr:hypothetical protein B0H14DRAFT_3860532 [Mycena olivaceomarginata]
MPPLKKAVHEQKEKYRTCIRGVGTVGATVSKVDNATSTELLLDGQRLGEYAPALQSNPLKQKLVREEKLTSYPAGLDTAGAFNLFWEDLKKPDAKSRYYQHLVMMPDGVVMMLTCLAALMRLLDDEGVTNFETDTTFSRVAGDMNEWEVVIFLKALQRAVTIARAYINKASTQFFEHLFKEFQSIKLELTGKPVAFKRLVPGGNLIAMNSDMEGAQPKIIKLCVTHAKHGILDFKSLVSDRDCQRLQDVKIHNWWDHKELHAWIIPCLVKSQSPISPDDWDNTPAKTNTGEGQHHWTKSRTGVKLVLVEAMESARKLDEAVVREIEVSYKSGILVNSQYAAEQLKELKALKSATKKLSSKSAGKSHAVVASSSSSGRIRPRPIASNPLRIHAEQAAPSTLSTTIGSSYFAFFMASSDKISIEFDPTQGQDLRTIFGNTSGSQANVVATVAFAPPAEHFPASPAA